MNDFKEGQPNRERPDRNLFLEADSRGLDPLDLSGANSSRFLRRTWALFLRLLWIPVALAVIFAGIGFVAGYVTHTPNYVKEISVALSTGVYNTTSSIEVAKSGSSLLKLPVVYEMASQMLSYHLAYEDYQGAVSISVPLESGVIHISLSAENPTQLDELSGAFRIAAEYVLDGIPQVAEQTWYDNQNEIRDDSTPRLIKSVLTAMLFGAAAFFAGSAIAFAQILMDERIHFVEESIQSPGLNFASLVFSPLPYSQTVISKILRKTFRVRRRKPPKKARAAVTLDDDPESKDSVMLLAAQIINSIHNKNGKGTPRGSAIVAFVTCGDADNFTPPIASAVNALSSFGQKLFFLDMTREAAVSDGWPYDDITCESIRFEHEYEKNALSRVLDVIAAEAKYDIVVCAISEIASSPWTVEALRMSSLVLPFIRLHGTSFITLRRLLGRLVYFGGPAGGLVFVTDKKKDLRKNAV